MTEPNSDVQRRLHNCGPGAREEFRCAAIGASVDLDLATALMGWDAIPWRRSRTVVSRRHDADEIDPDGIELMFVEDVFVGVCGQVLESLHAPRPRVPGMAEIVRSIVALVLEHGWHRELIGLARHAYRDPHVWRMGPSVAQGLEPRVDARDVALIIAAHAVYTPPLLLWTRVPSLDWLRTDILIRARCPWQDGAR
jgi:hypothetical protein